MRLISLNSKSNSACLGFSIMCLISARVSCDWRTL